jgi:gamma-aminobutyric acid receptor subunit beta
VPIFQRVLISICLLAVALTANAQSGATAGDLTAARPNAGGNPNEITVLIGLLDLVEINDRDQIFMADLYIEVEWQDPRLAVDGDTGGELRTFALDAIWHPRLTVVNSRGLDLLLPEVATVDRQGNVVARQRLAGPLAVDLELRDFPFDTQRLPINVVSYEYSPSEIVFTAASRLVGKFDDLGGEGWTYEPLEPERLAYRLQEGGRGGSQISFAVMAERQAGYYVFTLALPMTLILFLAWMAHWLPVDIIPPRMGMATATVFSLIAFGVSFRLTLPKIPYLTDADRFVLYSTLLVLVSLAVTVASVRWASTDRKQAAENLTRQARLAFPFLYGLIVVLTFTT